MSIGLGVVELEFSDRGFITNRGNEMVVITTTTPHTNMVISLWLTSDIIRGVMYFGRTKRCINRIELGEALLCDPNGFSNFIEEVVKKLRLAEEGALPKTAAV